MGFQSLISSLYVACLFTLFPAVMSFHFQDPATLFSHEQQLQLIRHVNTTVSHISSSHQIFLAQQLSSSYSTTSPYSEQCTTALNSYASCPGIKMLTESDGPNNLYSQTLLSSLCPCISKDSVLVQNILKNCNVDLYLNILLLNTILCPQPVKQDKYCGEEFGSMITSLSSTLYSASSGGEDGVMIMQRALSGICTECFDLIVKGMYRLIGEYQAILDKSNFCNKDCQSAVMASKSILSLGGAMSMLCLRNDNAEQVRQGNPYCYPYMMYTSTISPACRKSMDAKSCSSSSNGMCVWKNNVCYAYNDEAVKDKGRMSIPFPMVDMYCSNRCMFALLYLMADLQESQSLQLPSSTKDPSVSSYRALADSMSAAMCVKNTKGYCLVQYSDAYDNIVRPNCTSEIAPGADSAKCSSGCNMAFTSSITQLGCCYTTMQDVVKRMNTLPTDPNFPTCADVTTPPTLSCNPFPSQPQPVNLKISGTCSWYLTNTNVNKEILLNGTARTLGISRGSIQAGSFVVTDPQGVACTTFSLQTSSSTANLKVAFSLVAQDDATATRISTYANTNVTSVWIPSVDRAAATVSQSSFLEQSLTSTGEGRAHWLTFGFMALVLSMGMILLN
eukprot:PhF_6_TR664/c0_g1_i2/m.981